MLKIIITIFLLASLLNMAIDGHKINTIIHSQGMYNKAMPIPGLSYEEPPSSTYISSCFTHDARHLIEARGE